MAILKNTTITGTGSLTLPAAPTARRTELITTILPFTSVGTTSWSCPTGVTEVEVLVVAGGGGGAYTGSGGGAGGLIYRTNFPVISGTGYTVTVGAGGTAGASQTGGNGGNSVFGSLTAIGGGGGITHGGGSGVAGGSGSGASQPSILGTTYTGGAATAGQGFPGGSAYGQVNSGWAGGSAGGGGAGGPGVDGGADILGYGNGGPGLYFGNAFGTGYGQNGWFAGGGGGGEVSHSHTTTGGIGGGGSGTANAAGAAGSANTGGGGAGGGYNGTYFAGGVGGSGIVILKYRITPDASDPRGLVRYNTDVDGTEIYEDSLTQWVSQDQSKNYAGHNLLTFSEELTASGWTLGNATIGVNAATAPDGTVTADKLIDNTTAGVNHYILKGFTAAANENYCFSFYAKASGRTSLRTSFSNYTNWVGGNGVEVSFNLSTGTATPISSTPVDTGIISVGDGWYRIWAVGLPTTSISSNVVVYTENSPGNYLYQGDNSSGVLLWGLQLERGVRSPGPYNRTESATASQAASLGGYRIHRYTETGTCSFVPALTGQVEVLVVAGGGGAGTDVGGGGGGGGVLYNASYPVIAGKRYKVTVGGGGAAGGGPVGGTGANGGNSQFGSLVAIGGGGAGYYYARMGYNGGSGGGQGGAGPNDRAVIVGTIQPGEGTVGQGFRGGIRYAGSIGGGGGGGAGGPGNDQWGYGADGGPGVPCDISGTMTYYGGGGGAGDSGGTAQIGYGGIGGGGDGDSRNAATANLQVNGQPNTGGGGGGDGGFTQSGSGGSGIVIVRYRQN